MNAACKLCLIEDDEIMGESLCERFRLEGYEVDWFCTGGEALDALRRGGYAAIVSDYRLPDVDGIRLMETISKSLSDVPPILFITGFGAIDRAVALLKMGARDYLTKPFDIDELLQKIADITAGRSAGDGGGEIAPLGASAAMRQIAALIPRLARQARTLLLIGESGVGKEWIAQQLHAAGGVAAAPFVAINCGAIPENLLESELFGHEKGAFTGSSRTHRGVFERAHGGTLFLDEIGEMPLGMQVRLLRAIQERSIVRVGGEQPIGVDCRLICASNRDIKAMVQQGTFREDLYYRINLFQLRIPPLRERPEDIIWLARRFLDEIAAGQEHKPCLHPAAESRMRQYPWPGNVRELRHAIERACFLAEGDLITEVALFSEDLLAPHADQDAPAGGLRDYLAECERRYIERVLADNEGAISRSAEVLGISRKNLWEKMRKLGIQA